MTQYLLSAKDESADTTTATHQADASRTWVSQRRRSRTRSVGVAVVSTSAVYLAAAAGGVDFKLTDPGKANVVHLILPQIIGFTLFFALLGWGALAVLEHYSNRARTVWSVLAVAVLLLSFVPIGVEHATTATKIVLTVIHCCVAVALFPMLRHSPTGRRGVNSRPTAHRLRFGDGAGQDSATGLPAAMSAASWCSFAEDRRTPKGVSELRSSC